MTPKAKWRAEFLREQHQRHSAATKAGIERARALRSLGEEGWGRPARKIDLNAVKATRSFEPVADIAKRLGVSRSTVYRRLAAKR